MTGLRGTVLVTGASRGIGLATAQELARRGWHVALAARDGDRLAAAVAGIGDDRATAVPCDVSDPRSVEDAVAAVTQAAGPIAAVVNNAGVLEPTGPLHEVPHESFMRLLAVNVGGVANVCRAVLPQMRDTGGGVILNLSSGAARTAVPQWAAYCVSKAALAMLTATLHADYGASGVRAYGFVPGMVATDMLMRARSASDNDVTRVDEEHLLPPEIPARCIGWIIDNAPADRAGEELSIRDPWLRDAAGLPHRERW